MSMDKGLRMNQNSNAKYSIGSVDFNVVSDGVYWYDAGAIFGVVPRIMWERQQKQLDTSYRMPLGLNCIVLKSEGKTILVESGIGGKPEDRLAASPLEQGNLIDSLNQIDIAPEDIDIVINTHLHADHCGWNTRISDANNILEPTFRNATYLMSRQEWEDATNPNERTRATYLARNLDPIIDRLELIDPEKEYLVTNEVVFVPTPGHTAGHGTVVVRSGQEWGVYVGDMAQHKSQLERTAWASGLDILPLVSMETKKALMEKCIDDEALIIFCHGEFPGVGRMTRTSNGYRKWVDVDPTIAFS